VPRTNSTIRGLPKAEDDRPERAADGACSVTAAVCEHLLGDTFSPAALEHRTEGEPS